MTSEIAAFTSNDSRVYTGAYRWEFSTADYYNVTGSVYGLGLCAIGNPMGMLDNTVTPLLSFRPAQAEPLMGKFGYRWTASSLYELEKEVGEILSDYFAALIYNKLLKAESGDKSLSIVTNRRLSNSLVNRLMHLGVPENVTFYGVYHVPQTGPETTSPNVPGSDAGNTSLNSQRTAPDDHFFRLVELPERSRITFTFARPPAEDMGWRIDVVESRPWRGLEHASVMAETIWRELCLDGDSEAAPGSLRTLSHSIEDKLTRLCNQVNGASRAEIFEDATEKALRIVNRNILEESVIPGNLLESLWQDWNESRQVARGRPGSATGIAARIVQPGDWIRKAEKLQVSRDAPTGSTLF